MEKYILALDQGTTSSRAILFNHKGIPVVIRQKEFRQIFPKPGWVEHDPEDIWNSQFEVAKSVIDEAAIKPGQIAGIGITNQRETTLMWNRKTGKPVHNALVWQDRRTAGICERWKNAGFEKEINKKTGLVIDAYFSASKITWLLENVEGLREKAEKGEIAFGTVDSWLIWKLTNGKAHLTDATNASRTMLFNIHKLKWDKSLLEKTGIPVSILPEVVESSGVAATTGIFGGAIPVAGIAGDQQAALFGQLCTKKGMAKNTYGTGCFILMQTGKNAVQSKNRLLTTIAVRMNGKTKYALEGAIFNAGTVVQWLRDELNIIQDSSEIEELASRAADNGGISFVPSFTGLAAPYWDSEAEGLITGISRGTGKEHIARAALEGIALRSMEVLKLMEKDSGIRIKQLRVDGGASVNNLLMQIQADFLSSRIIRPKITETTAMGAAFLAGLATGFWQGIKEIKKHWQVDREFSPSGEDINGIIKQWKKAIRKVTTK